MKLCAALELSQNGADLAMEEAVNRRLITAGAQLRSQVSSCEICGRHSGTVTAV